MGIATSCIFVKRNEFSGAVSPPEFMEGGYASGN